MRRSTRIAVWLCCAGFLSLASSFTRAAPDAPVATTADGGRYYGPLVAGKRQGQGRMEWDNGARYEGGFHDGLFSGKGRFRYPTGDEYEGNFIKGVESGSGRLKSSTGATYVGEFRNGMYEGQGRFDDANGNTYEGRFKASLYHGQGKGAGPHGSYEGEYRQGEFWGKGEFRYTDGRTYRGDFVRGEFHGKGRHEDASGDVYEGDFVKSEFTGQGVFSGRGGMRHEGRFKKWRSDGPGKYSDGNGTVYEGEFVGGELTGSARIVSRDGTRYDGEIKAWMPNGKGELRRPNGDVYKGKFLYGVFDGEGTLFYAKPQADGRTKDAGAWRFGRLKGDEEAANRRVRANNELALYSQPALLSKSLAEIVKSDPQRINMYLLSVAGDGSQEVFRREVEFVRDQFDAKFGTRGRSLVLVNSRETAGKAPMATVTSVRQSLAGIAAAMNKERDILFMYVTSHGSREHEISLGLRGMDLPGLTARDLGAALKEAGIRWKVIVLSACYSGGFIDGLRDPNTLILTAARHDRQSFGCADENDFTYFGRAFFKDALPQSASFHEAFAKAETLIKKWEDRDADTGKAQDAGKKQEAADRHSLPQMVNPPAIQDHLRQWWAQLAASRGSTSAAQPRK